jgi:hypothetical protein
MMMTTMMTTKWAKKSFWNESWPVWNR